MEKFALFICICLVLNCQISIPTSWVWSPSSRVVELIKLGKSHLLPLDCRDESITIYPIQEFPILNAELDSLYVQTNPYQVLLLFFPLCFHRTDDEVAKIASQCAQTSMESIQEAPAGIDNFSLQFDNVLDAEREKVKDAMLQFTQLVCICLDFFFIVILSLVTRRSVTIFLVRPI